MSSSLAIVEYAFQLNQILFSTFLSFGMQPAVELGEVKPEEEEFEIYRLLERQKRQE